MSLYKDASLVMIPSAYKDGKLYSIRPTDGSGDFTFSRGSNLAATRVDVNGLIEKGRENILPYSNQFDTTWSSINASETSGQSGYDGTNNAWAFTDNTATDIHALAQFGKWTSSVCTGSIYVKAGSLSKFYVSNGTSGIGAFFNLSTGSVEGVIGAVIDKSITSVGGGWYRLSVTMQSAGTFLIGTYETFVSGQYNSTINYTGTSSNIYIQDAQLEQGLVATDYIETTTTSVSAGILEDMPRLDYSGGASCPSLLLEPSRTNLVLNSEYTIGYAVSGATLTDNNATSPEGVINAAKLECDGSSSIGQAYQNISIAASTTYTYSVFLKAGNNNFFSLSYTNMDISGFVSGDLSDGTIGDQTSGINADIKPYANGWYRVSLEVVQQTTDLSGRFRLYCAYNDLGTAFPSAGDANGQYIYAYGFQLEQGSYPTSYIPTYGTSQTRSSDISVKQNADLIGQTEGVLYWEGSLTYGENDDIFFIGDYTNTIAITKLFNNQLRFYIRQNGVQTILTSSAISSVNENLKVAFAYKSGDIVGYANGSQVVSSSIPLSFSATIPNITLSANAFWLNKAKRYCKQALLFKTRLTNAELAALTTL